MLSQCSSWNVKTGYAKKLIQKRQTFKPWTSNLYRASTYFLVGWKVCKEDFLTYDNIEKTICYCKRGIHQRGGHCSRFNRLRRLSHWSNPSARLSSSVEDRTKCRSGADLMQLGSKEGSEKVGPSQLFLDRGTRETRCCDTSHCPRLQEQSIISGWSQPLFLSSNEGLTLRALGQESFESTLSSSSSTQLYISRYGPAPRCMPAGSVRTVSSETWRRRRKYQNAEPTL